jgi:hypothetical protein
MGSRPNHFLASTHKFNIQHFAFNIQHSTFNIQHSTGPIHNSNYNIKLQHHTNPTGVVLAAAVAWQARTARAKLVRFTRAWDSVPRWMLVAPEVAPRMCAEEQAAHFRAVG